LTSTATTALSPRSLHDALPISTFAITRVAQTYGLHGVQVDVTFNAISVSYHRGEEDWPTTLMRVVRVASPDHAKLQRLQALLVEDRKSTRLNSSHVKISYAVFC